MKKYILIIVLSISVLVNVYFFLNKKTPEINTGSNVKNPVIVSNTGIAISGTGVVKKIVPIAPISLLEHFKKDGAKFDINKYEKNPRNVKMYSECSNYINTSSGSNFDMAKFLTTEIGSKIDFAVKLDCEKPGNVDYCKFLKEYKTIKEVTLDDAKFGLYALYNKDLSNIEFISLFSDKNRLNLGANLGSQIKYIEYYADIINGNLNNTENCVNFISKQGNTLLK